MHPHYVLDEVLSRLMMGAEGGEEVGDQMVRGLSAWSLVLCISEWAGASVSRNCHREEHYESWWVQIGFGTGFCAGTEVATLPPGPPLVPIPAGPAGKPDETWCSTGSGQRRRRRRVGADVILPPMPNRSQLWWKAAAAEANLAAAPQACMCVVRHCKGEREGTTLPQPKICWLSGWQAGRRGRQLILRTMCKITLLLKVCTNNTADPHPILCSGGREHRFVLTVTDPNLSLPILTTKLLYDIPLNSHIKRFPAKSSGALMCAQQGIEIIWISVVVNDVLLVKNSFNPEGPLKRLTTNL